MTLFVNLFCFLQVCCARPERIRWQETGDGNIPQNAIVAGNTANGEPLYVGRAREQGSLTPGKVILLTIVLMDSCLVISWFSTLHF